MTISERNTNHPDRWGDGPGDCRLVTVAGRGNPAHEQSAGGQRYNRSFAYVTNMTRQSEIANKNSFNIPLTVHWNPYFKKWDIHPGLGRQVVVDLFETKKNLDCIAFNTNGIDVNFKKIFYSYKELEDYYKNFKVQIYISPNYGTFIPHVHVDAEKTFMRKFFEKSYKSVYNVVKNYDIICDDVDLKPYFNCNTFNPDKKKIKIEIKKVSKRNILRSILLALTGKEYNYNNKIKITHLGKKII